jgi:hypothetical protein
MRANADARVTQAGGDAAASNQEMDRVEASIRADYLGVYHCDISLEEDYKDHRDKKRSLKKHTPLFLRTIIDSIKPEASVKLKADPAYVTACTTLDILGVLQAAENVLGRTGKYSFVATEAAYDKLTQTGLSWHEYTNQNKDLRQILADLGHAPAPEPATIKYLMRLSSNGKEFDEHVALLLRKDPLPTVEECVSELQDTLNLVKTLAASKGGREDKREEKTPRDNSTARHDTMVLQAEVKNARAPERKSSGTKVSCSLHVGSARR